MPTGDLNMYGWMNIRFNLGDLGCNCCQFTPIVSPAPNSFFKLMLASPVTNNFPDCSLEGRKPTSTFIWLLFFGCRYKFTIEPVPSMVKFHGCSSFTYGSSRILLLIRWSLSVS